MRPMNSTLLLNTDASAMPAEMEQSSTFCPKAVQGVSA